MGRIRQLGRTILSFLPEIGLVAQPSAHRPAGISAMMTVKNEEDWIEKSVASIADSVDQIVVVDNGSEDGTYRILSDLEKQLGGKLRLFSYPKEDFCAAVNFTLSNTSYRWILRWHGDFVARTTGDLAVSILLRRALLLDARRYFCIWTGPISLDGDLFHQYPQPGVELEPFLFVYSPSIHYSQIGRFEVLHVPWYYKRLEWRELYFFHMRSVKPARRMLYRFFWTEWMALPEKSRFPTLDSYVRHRITEVYGTTDLTEALRRHLRDAASKLVPYDRDRFGDYPKIIEDEVRNPKYQLIYKSGGVVSRNDVEALTGSADS